MKKNGSTLILFNNSRDKVFLVLRSDFPVWVLTGGGIEPGENSEQAALREAFEETGFKVKLIKLLGQYNQINSKNKIIKTDYIYEGRVVSGVFEPEFAGCQGRWFDLNNLPSNMTSLTKKILNDTETSFNKNYFSPFDFSDLKLLFLHPFRAIKCLTG